MGNEEVLERSGQRFFFCVTKPKENFLKEMQKNPGFSIKKACNQCLSVI